MIKLRTPEARQAYMQGFDAAIEMVAKFCEDYGREQINLGTGKIFGELYCQIAEDIISKFKPNVIIESFDMKIGTP